MIVSVLTALASAATSSLQGDDSACEPVRTTADTAQVAMIVFAVMPQIPSGYRITNIEVIVPLSILGGAHLLYPFALNPWFLSFSVSLASALHSRGAMLWAIEQGHFDRALTNSSRRDRGMGFSVGFGLLVRLRQYISACTYAASHVNGSTSFRSLQPSGLVLGHLLQGIHERDMVMSDQPSIPCPSRRLHPAHVQTR